MSSCRVDKPSEIVDVGDKVWVKLIGKEVMLIFISLVLCRSNILKNTENIGAQRLCVLSWCWGFMASVGWIPFTSRCDFGHSAAV